MTKTLWILAATGMFAVPAASTLTFASGHQNVVASGIVTTTTSSVDAQTAAADAIKAVGGGTAIRVSADHYQGQSVYDVHVLDNGTLWDVKVAMNGAIVEKKVSLEQPSTNPVPPSEASPPSGQVSAEASSRSESHSVASSSTASVSASQAGTIAVNAVGGGTVVSVSADHWGQLVVWDVHVLDQNQTWDVKVSQSDGAVLSKKLDSEQPDMKSSESPDASKSSDTSESEASSKNVVGATGSAGIVFDQKLATPPSGYLSYVQDAMASVHGVSLKWVKFSLLDNGDYEMAMKIRLDQGTVKVKDRFNASGQLLTQTIENDD